MNVADFISALKRELTWEEFALSPRVQHEYREYLVCRFQHTLVELAARDGQFTDALNILVNALDSRTRLEVITSPVLASLTIMPDSLFARGKRAFILKSLMECGDIERKRGESYCVLFDEELPTPDIDRGGTILAPVLDENSKSSILNKFVAADDIIQTNRATNAFALTNTELIVCRAENEFPSIFSSGSFRLMPGLTLVCNGHLPVVSHHNIANAIVHEAIHTVIYRFEAYGERLVPKENENSGRFRSPWTGALLNPTSLAQACLVWFGLYHFWKPRENEDAASNQQCERARSGFLSPAFVQTFRELAPVLANGVGSQLEELTDAARL